MKFMKTILVLIAIAFGVAFGAAQLTKNSSDEMAGIVDQLNPLVQTGTVYVKINKPVEIDGYNNAQYEQTAVDADGNTRPVRYSGMGVLKQGHYLALTNKGASVKTYAEVQPADLPAKAKAVLDQQ